MGILYLVPTPIGNLKDITLRAMETLFSVDLIACEDTRRTGILLQWLKNYLKGDKGNKEDKGDKGDQLIARHPPLISFNDHNETQRIPYLIELLKSGKNIALVSDAGTPLISDPGFKLVRATIEDNIRVESLPGPSSLTTAFPLSGLPSDRFVFLAFLQAKGSKRSTSLEQIRRLILQERLNVCLFESPHRLLMTLSDLRNILGEEQKIVIFRELTKVHEQVSRTILKEALNHFEKNKPRGEFVLLLAAS